MGEGRTRVTLGTWSLLAARDFECSPNPTEDAFWHLVKILLDTCSSKSVCASELPLIVRRYNR